MTANVPCQSGAMGAAIALVPPKLSEKELFGCSVDTHRPFAPGARVVVVGVSIAWPMLLQRRVPVWETCQHSKLGTESTAESHHSMLEIQMLRRTRPTQPLMNTTAALLGSWSRARAARQASEEAHSPPSCRCLGHTPCARARKHQRKNVSAMYKVHHPL